LEKSNENQSKIKQKNTTNILLLCLALPLIYCCFPEIDTTDSALLPTENNWMMFMYLKASIEMAR